MFQNVADYGKDNQMEFNNDRVLNILKEIFKIQNVVIYVLTFLISTLCVKDEMIPLGLALVAACIGEGIPIVGVFISAIIGILVGHGIASLGYFLILSALYFVLVLFFRSKVAVEERNETIKTGGKLFGASLILSIVKNIFTGFTIYNLFMGIIISSLLYVFYKVFVNGLSTIKNFNEKTAYSIEELIAGCIIIALASVPLNTISIFSLNLTSIIIIFLIMLLGWKNGMLMGAASGISLGIALTFVDSINFVQISMFAISGVLSGLLNKFGKIGVILGFVIGNAILTYWVRGASTMILYFREILIASIGLLIVPGNFKIDIEELLDKDKLLNDSGDKRLGSDSDVLDKLETLNNVISEIPQEEIDEKVKENLLEDFLDNIEEVRDNIFYQEVAKEENGLAKDICDVLIKEDLITDLSLIEVLKKHNNYVLLRDENIRNDLQEIVKIANKTLKSKQINKIKTVERKKAVEQINENIKTVKKVIDNTVKEIKEEKENKFAKQETEILILLKNKGFKVQKCNIRKLSNEKFIVELKIDYCEKNLREKDYIKNVSDLISKVLGNKIIFQREKDNSMALEYSQIYSSEDKYILQVGNAKATKDDNEISGDCSLQIKLVDGKYLLAIADGMGTGEKARECSLLTLKLIKQLLLAGFDKKDSIEILNSKLNLLSNSDRYSSLDMTILDLFVGKIECIKNAACTTYIKRKKEIKTIKSNSLPLGMLNKIEISTETVNIDDGDILIMCSDGILESKVDDDKWFENFIKNINTNNPQKMADLILQEAIDNNYGIVKDDMTVIVSKIVKRR